MPSRHNFFLCFILCLSFVRYIELVSFHVTNSHLLKYNSDVFLNLHLRLQKSLRQTGLLTIASNNTTGLVNYKAHLVYFG